jgi:transposase
MKNYIAIDVSKQVLNVYDGKNLFTVKNEMGLKGLKEYINKQHKGNKKNNLYIIFESTGHYSDYLISFCRDNRIKAYIMNPKRSANFSRAIGNRSKTDKIDAKTIYAFRVLIKEKEAKIPERNRISDILSSYISMYEFVLKTKLSIYNHIGSMKYQEHIPDVIFNKLKADIARYNILQEDIVKEAATFIESNEELKGRYHKLLTIPGIGEKSAIALIYLFTKYKNTNRSEITALTGLDPTRKESGISVRGSRRISKSGSRTVRKILYIATMNAIQHNETIKAFYDRLVNEKHKLKKVALIASMRKLLLIAHAVYKNNTAYMNYYKDKQRASAINTCS